jgi:hypothetical protein
LVQRQANQFLRGISKMPDYGSGALLKRIANIGAGINIGSSCGSEFIREEAGKSNKFHRL